MKSQNVFLLHHTRCNEEDDLKLLGVFSSESLANEAIEMYLNIKGFKDFPEGFEVSKYCIDKREWIEGFLTIDGKQM